jgi:hypothetical protein
MCGRIETGVEPSKATITLELLRRDGVTFFKRVANAVHSNAGKRRYETSPGAVRAQHSGQRPWRAFGGAAGAAACAGGTLRGRLDGRPTFTRETPATQLEVKRNLGHNSAPCDNRACSNVLIAAQVLLDVSGTAEWVCMTAVTSSGPAGLQSG